MNTFCSLPNDQHPRKHVCESATSGVYPKQSDRMSSGGQRYIHTDIHGDEISSIIPFATECFDQTRSHPYMHTIDSIRRREWSKEGGYRGKHLHQHQAILSILRTCTGQVVRAEKKQQRRKEEEEGRGRRGAVPYPARV